MDNVVWRFASAISCNSCFVVLRQPNFNQSTSQIFVWFARQASPNTSSGAYQYHKKESWAVLKVNFLLIVYNCGLFLFRGTRQAGYRGRGLFQQIPLPTLAPVGFCIILSKNLPNSLIEGRSLFCRRLLSALCSWREW